MGLWGRCGIRRAIHRPTGLGDWLILLAAHAGEGCDLGGSTGLLVKISPGWRKYQRYWRAASSSLRRHTPEGRTTARDRLPWPWLGYLVGDAMAGKTRHVWEVARSPLLPSRPRWREREEARWTRRPGVKGRRCTAQLGARLSVAWTSVWGLPAQRRYLAMQSRKRETEGPHVFTSSHGGGKP